MRDKAMTGQTGWQDMRAMLASLPMLVQMAAIFFFGRRPLPRQVTEHPDWLLHGICYGVLAYFAWVAVTARYPGIAMKKSLITAFMISTMYGIFDEVHQRFLPHRHASIGDVAADAVGAVLGLTLLWIVVNYLTKERKRNDE